jgi:Zn-dependent protease
MAGWRIDPAQGFWGWSLPCGRIAGIPVSIHWTLLLITAFNAIDAIRAGVPWWWLPILLVVPSLSVLLHEFGHAGAARLAGGGCDRIVLWMFGGAAMCDAPPRPWPQFAVAAAGPLVSLLLAGGCMLGVAFLAGRPSADVRTAYIAAGVLGALLAYTAWFNISLLLFNLLPCYPLDGGRMLRSLLWPLVGRQRAVRWTIWAAYACIVVGVALSLWSTNLMLLGLSLMLLMAVMAEHKAVRQGYDPEFGDAEMLGRRGGTAWDRWQARRAEAREAREELRAATEQAELDRLLAKVSVGGLPSLTEAERRTLRGISERERERSGR